ncbi:MAG: hypothetical protein P0Y60_05585 [Candidatus Microbacterium colombiense]|nr:MAG: hypothetical protein P0Y60_05585 [Microbacterium sp.]
MTHDPDHAVPAGADPLSSGEGIAASGAARFSTLATSAEGVYGLVIVAGMIVVSRNLTASSGEALLSVVATLLVFFAAHVYAAAVSWMAEHPERDGGIGAAIRHGFSESVGLLGLAAVPVVILFLGFTGLLHDGFAVWMALGVDVLLLAIVGWVIAGTRTRRIWSRLGGALVTASFGGILIALKALLHH